GSLLGEKLCTRFAPIRILIITELLGLLALLFPLLGMHYHSITALLAVQSCEALLSGMSWPALTLLFKRGLPEPELPAATCLEHVIFASQVLLGTGLGVLLFQHVPMAVLLATDALSFGGSLLLLYQTGRAFSGKPAPSEPDTPQAVTVSWQSLTLRQKRSLLLLPALAAV
ncbi:MFS transporter, partial [Escherichia coli]|nr:MFS transporter [Escherichia coli]